MRAIDLLLRATSGIVLFTVGFAAPAGCEPTSGNPSPNTAALGAGLETFDLAQIRKDVEWIAADDRLGRDTPSEGLEATARYLAQRLEQIGFDHGARGGYLYRYPLGWRQLDLEESHLTLAHGDDALRLAFGTDYSLARLGDMTDLDAIGDCVSIGDGGRSVFKQVDLKGKWAWCWDDGSSPKRTISRAQEAGAVGILWTPGDDYDRSVYPERFAGVSKYVLRGSLGRSAPEREEEGDIPSVFLAPTAAARVLKLAGLAPEDLSVGRSLGISVEERRRLTYPGGYRLFENVGGLWPGSDPVLRNEVLIVSAHYDHVGARGDEIYNGADDNASGSAGMLALARALAAYGPMRRSVLLLWVSGEEKGLLGSRAWTLRPWLPEGMYPVANINVDMIGRNDPKELLITPSRRLKDEYNGIVKLAEKLAPVEGFASLGSADEYWRRSDHMNFADNLDLPVAFLFADTHPDYHKPTDTADKIDYDKLARGARLLLRILDGLQADKLDLGRGEVPGAAEFGLKVRRGTAQTDLEVLSAALERYHLDSGRYPRDLAALVEEATRAGILAELPKDPWGHPYVYDPQGDAPRLLSYGSDGAPGGVDEAEDLVITH